MQSCIVYCTIQSTWVQLYFTMSANFFTFSMLSFIYSWLPIFIVSGHFYLHNIWQNDKMLNFYLLNSKSNAICWWIQNSTKKEKRKEKWKLLSSRIANWPKILILCHGVERMVKWKGNKEKIPDSFRIHFR